MNATAAAPRKRKSGSRLDKEQFTQRKCPRGKWMIIARQYEGRKIFKRVFTNCMTFSCPICRVKKRQKLYKLIEKKCPAKDFNMLTLTLRENFDPLSVNWKRLNHCWDILLKRIRKITPNVKYFRCVELQKNGMPHIHALINFYMPLWKIQRIWKEITDDSFIAKFEKVRENCAGYILKYFYQAVRDIHKIRTLTGKKTRIFNASRNLLFVETEISDWKVLEIFDSKFSACDYLKTIGNNSRILHGRIGPLDIEIDETDSYLSLEFWTVETELGKC